MSIKTRLTLWFLLAILTLLIVSATVAYSFLLRGLREMDVSPMDMWVGWTEGADEEPARVKVFQPMEDWLSGSHLRGIVLVHVFSGDELSEALSRNDSINVGSVVIDSTALGALDVSSGQQVSFYVSTSQDESSNQEYWVAAKLVSDRKFLLEEFRQVLLVALPITLTLAGLLGLFLARRVLVPIRSIAAAAREIGANDLHKRLEVKDNDELGGLASIVNHMLERLEAAFERQRQFTSDAAHELRTPLAIIQAEATLALRKGRTVDEYRHSLEDIYRESALMASFVDRLLLLARTDSGDLELVIVNVDLGNLLMELASDVKVLCDEKDIRFRLESPESHVVVGDETMLRNMFLNLLSNAVHHTPAKGRISMSLDKVENMACVSVEDTGAGIPQEHIAHIFERFYRVGKSHPRGDGGAGLGLSICLRIAELHGGTISVKSITGVGSTFKVLLPLTEWI